MSKNYIQRPLRVVLLPVSLFVLTLFFAEKTHSKIIPKTKTSNDNYTNFTETTTDIPLNIPARSICWGISSKGSIIFTSKNLVEQKGKVVTNTIKPSLTTTDTDGDGVTDDIDIDDDNDGILDVNENDITVTIPRKNAYSI